MPTMADLRARFPEYHDLSDKDLVEGLHHAYAPDIPLGDFMTKVGYSDSLGQTLKDVGSGAKGLAEGAGSLIQNAGASAVGGVSSLLAAIQNLLGQHAGDPSQIRKDVTASLSHQPTNPAARAVTDTAAAPFRAAGDLLHQGAAALPDWVTARTPLVAGAQEGLTDAASLLPAAGASRVLANTAESAMAPKLGVAQTPADVANAAGFSGLNNKTDMTTGGSQAIVNTLIKQHAGLRSDAVPTHATLSDALNNGPGAIFNRAEDALPDKMTASDKLTAGIKSIDDTVSQLPKSPDIDALKQTMLSQPEMTSQQLFANVRVARQRASSNMASEDPNKQDLGKAYAQLAGHYEDFIGDQLQANPGSGIDLSTWKNARMQYAQNREADAALHGENFDPAVFGRIYHKAPNLLSGNGAIVGQIHDALPAAKASDAVLPTVAAGGAGELLSQHMGLQPGLGALAGAIATPKIRSAVSNFMTRGNPEAAASTSSNPMLSYFFNRDQTSPFTPRLNLEPPPGNAGPLPPSQGSFGPLPQGPGPNPSLSLTPPAGPVVEPHQYSLGDFALGAGLKEPSLSGISRRATAPGAGDLSLEPEQPFKNAPRYTQLGDILSQGVPEGIMQRTPRAGGQPDTIPGPLPNGSNVTENHVGGVINGQRYVQPGDTLLTQGPENAPHGMLSMTPSEDGSALHITNTWTDPDIQARGLGQQRLQDAAHYAADRDIPLHSDPSSTSVGQVKAYESARNKGLIDFDVNDQKSYDTALKSKNQKSVTKATGGGPLISNIRPATQAAPLGQQLAAEQ